MTWPLQWNHIDNEHKAIDAKYTLYDKNETEVFGLGYEKSKKHKITKPFFHKILNFFLTLQNF
jgi:hypothetical protein